MLGRPPAFFFPSSSSLCLATEKAYLSSRASWAEISGAGGVTQAISPTLLPPSLLAGQSLRRSVATPPAWLCKPGREAAILVRAGCGALKAHLSRGQQQSRGRRAPARQAHTFSFARLARPHVRRLARRGGAEGKAVKVTPGGHSPGGRALQSGEAGKRGLGRLPWWGLPHPCSSHPLPKCCRARGGLLREADRRCAFPPPTPREPVRFGFPHSSSLFLPLKYFDFFPPVLSECWLLKVGE